MQGNSCRTAELGLRLLLEISTWFPSLKVSIISVDSGEAELIGAGFSSTSICCLGAFSSWVESGAPSQLSRFDSDEDSMKRTLRLFVPSSSEVMLESVFYRRR